MGTTYVGWMGKRVGMGQYNFIGMGWGWGCNFVAKSVFNLQLCNVAETCYTEEDHLVPTSDEESL